MLFQCADDASSDPIGFIGFDDIGDVRVQATKGDGTVINIKTDRRTWVLRADSPNNARLWASGLRACAEYYRVLSFCQLRAWGVVGFVIVCLCAPLARGRC